MKKLIKQLTLKRIVFGISLILFDITIYIFFGLLLMNYDDFYEKSKGEHWCLESMSTVDRLISLGLQFWNLINIAFIIYVIFRIVTRIRKSSIIKE